MKKLIYIAFLIFVLISLAETKKGIKIDKKRVGNNAPAERRAIVEIKGLSVEGNITFSQESRNPVHIYGTLHGLSSGSYGFHVHEKGDVVGNDCMRTGAHFNPHKAKHGGPGDKERHIGDLGNIDFNHENFANIDFYDSKISLYGENSIIGRGLVVHSDPDDLGKGQSPDSLKTGNAGSRLGCGVIGIM